jgi:hypothetical protein
MASFRRRLVTGLQRALSKDNEDVQNAELQQGTLDPSLNPSATTSHIPHKSSSVSPDSRGTVSQSNDIPKNILAFRLITKMLQWIPQTNPFVSTDNLGDDNNWMSSDRQEVRISDAFAHLAIAEHGCVAIATNRQIRHSSESEPDLTLKEPKNLGIIACATPSGITSSEGSMKATPNIGFFDKMWNIMLTKNARNDDPICLQPLIITSDEPSDFSNFPSLNAYMKNLEENW